MNIDISRFHVPNRQSLIEAIKSERYLTDPCLWVKDTLNEFIWSKQREIIESVKNNRRTAVQSCFGPGKSFIAARVVAWWLSVHEPGTARVITSAPGGDQVKAIMWHEIGRAHSRGKLPGRLNQTEWWINIPGSREELVGIGRKPAEHNPAAFQGIHERYVLVVLDEAAGIPKSLWDAADGLLSNDDCRILSIGNPDDSTSEFANECKPGSGSHVIRISAFDTPNFTGESVPDEVSQRLVGKKWVEEKRIKWGESNPLYIAKVLGLFPEISADGIFPISWIKSAQERSLPLSQPSELGVDVGGGGNKSVICHRQGDRFRIIRRDNEPNTMKLLGHLIIALRETNSSIAKVDYVGIGKGLVDRAEEISMDTKDPNRIYAAKVVGINVGKPAYDSKQYVNLRAEGFGILRTRFEEDRIDLDPVDDDVAAQLVALKWRPVAGRMQVESKEEIRRSGRPSPDDADALMLASLPAESPSTEVEATWGW